MFLGLESLSLGFRVFRLCCVCLGQFRVVGLSLGFRVFRLYIACVCVFRVIGPKFKV